MTPWMLAAGAAAVIGAAGTAYWQRDTLTTSLSWATSHLSFVVELWSPTALEARLEAISRTKDVGFHWCVRRSSSRCDADASTPQLLHPPP